MSTCATSLNRLLASLIPPGLKLLQPHFKPVELVHGAVLFEAGDVFRRDGDGFHYFPGRTDDMFVSGGENIYPGDVERMLERHPAVAQACVVPIDDDIKGQKPVAFIIAKSGVPVDAEEIKRFALANAPAYQHPHFVWFVDRLPLSTTNNEMGSEATQ
jgi:long-chain acyl-CoA synthetase